MRLLKSKLLALLLFPFLATAQDKLAATAAPYQASPHSGSLTILTTPEGADLPASAAVEGFPLLVRLSGDRFDFKQARAGREDLRYSTKDGAALAFEIEE